MLPQPLLCTALAVFHLRHLRRSTPGLETMSVVSGQVAERGSSADILALQGTRTVTCCFCILAEGGKRDTVSRSLCRDSAFCAGCHHPGFGRGWMNEAGQGWPNLPEAPGNGSNFRSQSLKLPYKRSLNSQLFPDLRIWKDPP